MRRRNASSASDSGLRLVAKMMKTLNGISNFRPVCSVRKSTRLSSGTIQRLSRSRGGIRWRPKSSTTNTPPLAFIWIGAS